MTVEMCPKPERTRARVQNNMLMPTVGVVL